MDFIARFHFYSPFNAMLIHIQMEGANYVAPARRWHLDYRRRIKSGARPIVILQPMGPVMFVFDVADTEPLPGAAPLPDQVERLFEVRTGQIGDEFSRTVENAKRDGIVVVLKPFGSQRAGSLRAAEAAGLPRIQVQSNPLPKYVPQAYEALLNSNLSTEALYATLRSGTRRACSPSGAHQSRAAAGLHQYQGRGTGRRQAVRQSRQIHHAGRVACAFGKLQAGCRVRAG